MKNRLVLAAFGGLALFVVHVAAQGAPPATPAPTGTPQGQAPQGPAAGPPAGRGQGGGAGAAGQGRGGGGGRAQATFPAGQRPPGDPVLIEKGKVLYGINCQSCHGVDLRGGDMGGPNLLRSQVLLSDQSGELVLPIVRGSRQANGMDPINITDDDVKAVSEYLHSVLGTIRNQGMPPATGMAPPAVVIGDAAAGQAYFASKCSTCHSATGDLKDIGSRYPEPKALQNRWVSGGGGRGGGGRGGAPDARTVMVTVTQASGDRIEGRLVRVDDFLVTLAQTDGTVRTFRRDGDKPKVEVRDPMKPHRDLLGVYTDKDIHNVTAYLVTLK